MKVLITGGAGFIGSNFIRYLLANRPEWQITNFDNLTYAGNLANLDEISGNENYRFVKGDISSVDDVRTELENGHDYLINFAAESHVDRSLYDPGLFIKTNVYGTQLLLEIAQKTGVKRFLHISTDEVYGSLKPGDYAVETSRLTPNSPYAASKAAADLICRSYFKTFDMPVIVTRSCNNYGPYQFPEKLIPLFITNLMADKKVPVYGDGLNVRDWIHVIDHCSAILAVVENGKGGNVYNIGGNNEQTNLDITKMLLELLGKDKSMMEYVKDRLGHDRRYAIDAGFIKAELGWEPKIDFTDGLAQTVQWYIDNKSWWQDIKTGAYLKYYEQQYGKKL